MTYSKLGTDPLHKWRLNRPFPSSLVPLFQSESKCKSDFNMHENETACRTHFHLKGFTLGLVLKQRHKNSEMTYLNNNTLYILSLTIFT